MNVYGELIRGQLHNSASDLTPTANGLIYVNTTDHVVKAYINSGWKTLVDTTTAQILTSKDYDGGTASNSSRITIPKASFSTLSGLTRKQGTIVYDTDSNTLFSDDGSSLNAIGSGSGGGINYISNPSAESATTGWSTYDDAAATPVDGTGGTVTTTWTRSTSSPLRDTASFLLSKDAANRSGEGVSYDFTIDAADKSRTLKISFDVDATDSDYVDDDIYVWIYDVTNAALIYPAYQKIKKAAYTFETTFVTSTSTSYRLLIHYTGTNAAAVDVKFDNFQVGPQNTVIGEPNQDWTSFTPTGSWSANTTYTGFWQRRGSNVKIQYLLSLSGAPTSATLTVNLPSGMTLDTTKLAQANSNNRRLGNVSILDSGTALYMGTLEYSSTTAFQVDVFGAGGSYVDTATAVTQAAPFTFANNDRISIWTEWLPIAEWAGSSAYLSSAQPEYAYNTGTWDAADTTNFAYGPGGQALGGSLTASRSKRVRFLTPIQSTDKIEIQGSYDRTVWFPINGSELNDIIVIPSTDSAGTAFSGVSFDRVSGSTTDIDVTFGRYINIANDDSPATNWPSSNAYWRAVKIPGHVQVATPTSVKWQKKEISADVATDTDFITFNNLIVGRTYRLSGVIRFQFSSTGTTGAVIIKNGTSELQSLNFYSQDTTNDLSDTTGFNIIFVASQTTAKLTTSGLTTGTSVQASGSSPETTWAIIEELFSYSQTSDFT